MNITLDQVEAFTAVIKEGTIQGAARKLGKGHSAIMYLIKQLEGETQVILFDRKGYRNRLTSEGQLVLRYCQQFLQTKEEMAQICLRLKGGWEARLSLVYDGVIDFDLITNVLLQLNKEDIPTEIRVSSAYLDEVEQRFSEENADMMLTILPNYQQKSPSLKLAPLTVFLVAHKDHDLNQLKRKCTLKDLNNHTYILVRGSVTSIGLSTEQMEVRSTFIVNDFYTKKQAILKGLGYGWLPEYMIHKEIKSKVVKVISAEFANKHVLYPRLYHKKKEFLGKGAEALIQAFRMYHLKEARSLKPS